MPKPGLPSAIKMKHDSHYVDELTDSNKPIGRKIAIDKIEPNPEQPRTEIGDLSELVASVKRNGVLEPLLVKPVPKTGKYIIIAGERRWRSANLAGLTEVPCIELDIDEKSIAEIALIENLQRKDLTIWEVADGLQDLADRFDYTHDDIAKKIGKSRTSVTESLTLAKLPQTIREKCVSANIKAKSTLLEVARQFDEEAMENFIEKIKEGNLNRGEIRQKARPKSTQTAENKRAKSKARKSNNKTAKNIYKFKSKENNFKLSIDFDEKEDFNKRDILKALKEAFDSVKKVDM